MKNDTTVIDQGDSEVLKIPKKLKPPRKYKVIYHNDDYTPMEFVTWSLMEFFKRTEIDAQSITLEVHKLGSAVAGVYEYQIAGGVNNINDPDIESQNKKYMKF